MFKNNCFAVGGLLLEENVNYCSILHYWRTDKKVAKFKSILAHYQFELTFILHLTEVSVNIECILLV